MNRMKTATSAVLHPATSMMNSIRLISAWPRGRSRTRWLDISLPSEASRKSDGARVSSTEPHPHHDCDKPDKPCRRHLRETPVYRIKIKRLSAETMNVQSSGAASMDQHLSSPETRRCVAPIHGENDSDAAAFMLC